MMIRALKRESPEDKYRPLYHCFLGVFLGKINSGAHPKLYGDSSKLGGNCDGVKGDATGVYGSCSDVHGDLDHCGITKQDRELGICIKSLIHHESYEEWVK